MESLIRRRFVALTLVDGDFDTTSLLLVSVAAIFFPGAFLSLRGVYLA